MEALTSSDFVGASRPRQEVAMNDPHVVALIYRIAHGDTIDYSQARRLEVDEPRFRLTVEERQARFELKAHHATEEQARDEIADYIRTWEFDATLKRGNPDAFRLEFEKAEVIDRNPTPGVVRLSARFEAQGTGSARITLRVPEYPAPPTDIALDPDAETMHQRYLRHRQGGEPLPAMAYFCLTVLELAAGGRKGRRQQVSDRLRRTEEDWRAHLREPERSGCEKGIARARSD